MKCLSQAVGEPALALGLVLRLHAPLLAAYTLQGWSPAVLRGMGSGLSAAFLNTGWLLNGSFPHLTAEEMEVQTGHGTLPSPTPLAHLACWWQCWEFEPISPGSRMHALYSWAS